MKHLIECLSGQERFVGRSGRHGRGPGEQFTRSDHFGSAESVHAPGKHARRRDGDRSLRCGTGRTIEF
jgi:hypothetical protein